MYRNVDAPRDLLFSNAAKVILHGRETARRQLRLKDTERGWFKPGQTKRQKCDHRDNILLCLMETSAGIRAVPHMVKLQDKLTQAHASVSLFVPWTLTCSSCCPCVGSRYISLWLRPTVCLSAFPLYLPSQAPALCHFVCSLLSIKHSCLILLWLHVSQTTPLNPDRHP